jgi:methyl-accepting chemotaxis protein
MGIRAKAVWFLVAASLTPLLVLSIAAYDSASRALTETAERNLSAEASVALGRFDALVAEARTNLAAWSEQAVLQQALIDDGDGNIAAELMRLHSHYGSFTALHVTNADGRIVASTDAKAAGQDLSATSLFSAVGQGEQYESNGGTSSAIERASLVIASPIRADYDADTIIGALVAVIDWASLQPVFGTVTVTGSAQDDAHRLVIVDAESGHVIYGPSMDGQTITADHPLAPLTIAGIAPISLEGRDFMAATAVTGQGNTHPLRVHAIVDSHAALATVRDLRRTLIGLTILAIAAVGGLGYLAIERSLTRPLSVMTASIGELARGNRDARVPGADRRDEIGDIARSLGVIRDMGVHAARVQTALDNTTSIVLIADTDGAVFYGNSAARHYFAAVLGDLAAALPLLAATRLEELRIERFFADPAQAKARMSALSETWREKLQIGQYAVELVINPVVNDTGARLGSVVEWTDLTDQVAMQAELQQLVDAAAAGDFSRRVDLTDVTGFKRRIAEGINRWAETAAAAFGEVIGMMSAIASGNLTVRISGAFDGDLLQLKKDANATADKLAEIVGQTVEGVNAIRGATSRLAEGAEDLSSRTEKQVADLAEMAGATRELAVTLQRTAANAKQASDLAAEAQKAAEDGGAIAAAAVDAVTRIEASSSRIGEIVGLIQDIASQTNLLALNAAVEAARAGDAGRGFAVVAAEVRELAQRTAQASKDIRGLVEDSSVQVRAGVDFVTKAGTALSAIVTSTKHAAEIVSQIAAASGEQADDVRNADESVSRMESATQQNARLVEHTTASLAAVDQQIKRLFDLISFFDAEGVRQPAWPAIAERRAKGGSLRIAAGG